MNVLTQLLPFLYRWCRVWWQRNPARCVRHWWLPVHQSQQYSTSGAWWKDTERAHVRETDGRGLTSSRGCWWFWRGRGWGIYGWVNSLCLFSFPVEFIEGLLFLLIVQKLVLKKKKNTKIQMWVKTYCYKVFKENASLLFMFVWS